MVVDNKHECDIAHADSITSLCYVFIVDLLRTCCELVVDLLTSVCNNKSTVSSGFRFVVQQVLQQIHNKWNLSTSRRRVCACVCSDVWGEQRRMWSTLRRHWPRSCLQLSSRFTSRQQRPQNLSRSATNTLHIPIIVCIGLYRFGLFAIMLFFQFALRRFSHHVPNVPTLFQPETFCRILDFNC